MSKNSPKITDKLFFQRYILGISRSSIHDIIRTKKFDPEIKWLPTRTYKRFRADPFFVQSKNGDFKILYEEFFLKDDYAAISLLTLNEDLKETCSKILLDTKNHLSFPFVFTERDKIYVFPESSKSGKLSCYEYNPELETLSFVRHIIELPLVDSTILLYRDKYWIFGSVAKENKSYELLVFFSDKLLGPYQPHPTNPVESGLNGIRAAGNFIIVDDCIYRPTQNCENEYGESITINKVTNLDENYVYEEPYMQISINKNNRLNNNIRTIHTINILGDYLTVDGKYYSFAPLYKLLKFFRGY